jgi:hypothetical protein
MESHGATPIRCVRVGSSVDQRRNSERAQRRGRDVQRRTSDVYLLWDFHRETLIGDARLREFGRRSYELRRWSAYPRHGAVDAQIRPQNQRAASLHVVLTNAFQSFLVL